MGSEKMFAAVRDELQHHESGQRVGPFGKRAHRNLAADGWRLAREVARKAAAIYLNLPNYRNNLKRLGYTDADLDDGGSDRLIDAVVAWGDEKTIADRIQAHRDAGASHVCIQPLHPEGKPLPDERILEVLAPRH